MPDWERLAAFAFVGLGTGVGLVIGVGVVAFLRRLARHWTDDPDA